MKKLTLINPLFKEDEKGRFGSQISEPPLSLCFIGTYVRNNSNCEVEIVDPIPQGLDKKRVLKKVEESDIVGLICYTYNRHQCFDFGRKIKIINPHCKLIIGGPHASALDEKILQYYPFVDVVCRGEGEETMLEIIKGKPFRDIKGITWINNGKIIRNPDRPFRKDIDDFYCDFSLLPDFDRYRKDIYVPGEIRSLRTAYLVVSRGCPFNCIFCASCRWKRIYRAMSAKKVVEQIEQLVKEYGIEYIRFHDDMFFSINKKEIMRFCELMRKKRLDIKFSIASRVDTISREVFRALKEIGCVAVGMGIESGSEKVLQVINKRTSIGKILRAIEILNELDYWKIGFFIIGLPREKEEDYRRSLKLSKYFEYAACSTLIIYPDTPLYMELKRKGEINDDFWFNPNSPRKLYFSKERFSGAEWSIKEIIHRAIYFDFYHTLHRPESVIRRYGIVKGALSILEDMIDMPFKGKLKEIHWYLKERFKY